MPYSLSNRLELLRALGLVGLRVVEHEGEQSKTELLGKDKITVKNDSGRLCQTDPGTQITFAIIAEAERPGNLFVFEAVGRARSIQILNDQTREQGTATYAKTVHTYPDKNNNWVTKLNDFQNNGFWLVKLADSRLEMWEICIVTNVADGFAKFYLSLQRTYTAGMYNNNGQLAIPEKEFPGYKTWKALQTFLKDNCDVNSLKPWSSYKWPEEEKRPELRLDQAETIFFSQSRRYGLAKVPRQFESSIVHATDIIDGEFPALDPGQICTYEEVVLTPPKGNKLKGVRPI